MNPISDIMQNKPNKFHQSQNNNNQTPPTSAYDQDQQTNNQDNTAMNEDIQGVNLTEIANKKQDGQNNTSHTQQNQKQEVDTNSELQEIIDFTKNIKSQLNGIISVLEMLKQDDEQSGNKKPIQQKTKNVVEKEVEGVFDGQKMIGSDTNQYEVPIDFIDNKKLVEGDLLRLKIKSNGEKLFKQAGSVKRERLIGNIKYDNQNQQWKVVANNQDLNIMEAFTNIYNVNDGDKVSVLIPANGNSTWATIENVFN